MLMAEPLKRLVEILQKITTGLIRMITKSYGRNHPFVDNYIGVKMEFIFYFVACFGIIAIAMPLFSISNSLARLSSVVEVEEQDQPVRARVRTN
tara:strand:- start:76 stop:357 length:282 start_codon:yes stop_codon:yes gene_type:complete